MARNFLLALVLAILPGALAAHSLGVDRADLVETAPGVYTLTAHVPPRIAPAIRAPQLPARCALDGSPAGERGGYSVRFAFTCTSALTSSDRLLLPWQRDGTLLTVTWFEQEPVTRLARREGAAIELELSDWLAGSGSFQKAAGRYTLLGIEHILLGIDHLLFVLALLFVVHGGWALVKTITGFTVAHSITLALATFGVVSLPAAPVEAAIALSIMFLAMEIVKHDPDRPSLTYRSPWLVAFAFGLLHGLGFAGALSEIGLPPTEIPIALLFFNVGVELGQLAFVAVILALIAFGSLLRPLQRFEGVTKTVVVYGIGTLAAYWFVERSVSIVA